MGPLRIFNLTGDDLVLPSYLRLPSDIVDVSFSLRKKDAARGLTAGDILRLLVSDYSLKPDDTVAFAFPGLTYRGVALLAAFNGRGRYTPEACYKCDPKSSNIARLCGVGQETDIALETIFRHPLKVARRYRLRIPDGDVGPTATISLDAEYFLAYALVRLMILKRFQYPWIISNTMTTNTEPNWTCAHFADCRLSVYTSEYIASYS